MTEDKNRILVICIDNKKRATLSKLLLNSGFLTYEAKNGEESIAIASRETPDLILCDIILSDIHGNDVLELLKELPHISDIPILYLKNQSDKVDLKVELGLGSADFINRPYNAQSIITKVKIKLEKFHQFKKSKKDCVEILQSFSANKNNLVNSLLKFEEIETFAKKQLIYNEGDLPKWLFYVESGGIKLFKRNDFGKEFITQIISKGQFFGYRTLLIGTKYNNCAEALTTSTLRLIPRNSFFKLIDSSKMIANKFIELISKSAIDCEQDLVEMAYSSVRRKVARALLVFADDKSIKPIIKLAVSREDLASKAGTAKETLIRTLSDFKSEGLIDIKGKLITILNFDGLRFMPQ
jgi:CRP-like cAMP-binding protein/CheY-like chemotaxis protein